MKVYRLVCGIILTAGVVFSAPRMPVGEMFSATWCGPCAMAADYIDEHYPDIEPIAIIIRYEVDPGGPFDDYDASGMNDRVSTYFSGTYGVPNMHIDGVDYGSGPYATWFSVLESRAGTEAPVDIQFTELTMDSVELTISLDDPTYAGSYELNVMLIEDSIHYSAPNGQTIFNQIFRTTMTNSHSGDMITLSESSPVVVKYAVPSNPDWVPVNCYIVAFVQDRSSLAILQGARTPLYRPDYYFTTSPSSGIATAISTDTSAEFSAFIRNQGANDDTYNITVELLLPESWTATTYADGVPFSSSTTLSVASGHSREISATVNSNGFAGSGKVRFIISSPHLTGESDTVIFTLNAGANVLLVDDDEGASYEQWFMQSLENLGIVYYYYDHTAAGPPTGTFLNQFDLVIWQTGADYSYVIVANDMIALRTYLDNGGALYFSSPEIGYYVNEGGGTAYRTFYNDYLKATYEGNNADTRSVVGVSGDPIGDGLSFSISGGDGADDQNYPDYISPTGGSVAFLDYSGGTQHAAVRYEGEYRLVYTAFGFEGIASAEVRDTLMGRILHYLNPDVFAVRETPKTPDSPTIAAYPNPFNSSCKIVLPADAELEIYNIAGNLVFADKNRTGSAGTRTVIWNPENLPGGVYLVRAESGTKTITRKVLYLK